MKTTPNTVISPGEVWQKNDTYRRHTIQYNLIPLKVYLKIKGHKEIYTNVIQTPYEYDMAYTLDLFPAPENIEPQDLSVKQFSKKYNQVLCYKNLCHMHTRVIPHTRKVVHGLP